MKKFLFLLVLIVLLAGCGGDGKARVIFDNQSACGTIPITLTNMSNSDDVLHVDAPAGQRTELVVTPNVSYEYLVDFSGAGKNPEGFRCTAQERGQIKVPANASQTFTLVAETPVPTLAQPATQQ